MENDHDVGDDVKVRDSIREAIRKLTDDKGVDCAADPPPSAGLRGATKPTRQKDR
jgi:hypothetical protein